MHAGRVKEKSLFWRPDQAGILLKYHKLFTWAVHSKSLSD